MIIDSSVWLEILQKGPKYEKCHKSIDSATNVRVPSIVIFELYKKIKKVSSEEDALDIVAMLSSHEVLDLNRDTALLAGDLVLEYKLAMADSIMLAHARLLNDELVTLDNDFRNIPGVRII